MPANEGPDQDLHAIARPGAEFEVKVTPRAGRTEVRAEAGRIAVRVTAPPADGKANVAVQAALAKALGVAKSRLVLVRGASGRIKRFRLEG